MSNNFYANIENELHNTEISKKLLNKVNERLKKIGKPVRFMEVCGTHTVSIFQSGLRSILPKELVHLSGPGCPVCVTDDTEIAQFMELAAKPNVIITCFGDLIRVPDIKGQSLKDAKANGANVEIVYSALDALELAKKNPNKEIVFLAVGFETTAPTIAATLKIAKSTNINNFSILSCHKLVPPALELLLEDKDIDIDAFLLPGHVAIILGLEPFNFIAEKYHKNAVVAGFEVNDILLALIMMLEQIHNNEAKVTNAYTRAVEYSGNQRAKDILNEVFELDNAIFRGLGLLPNSGLKLNKNYANFDAFNKFNLQVQQINKTTACKCGEVLKGKINPPMCPLFAKACTPQNPKGPCMVSSEGSCSAFYNLSFLDYTAENNTSILEQ